MCYSNFVRKCLRYLTSKMSWPWNRVKGTWRSLKMSPFDRAYDFLLMFYSNDGSILCRFWDTQCRKCCDLEIRVRDHSRLLKVVPFHRLGMVSYCSIVTVPKTQRFWIIQRQKCRDLDNRVRGPSRSLEMSPFDRAHVTSYWRSMALSSVVSEIFNV